MFGKLYTAEPTFAASIRLPALGHIDQPIQKLELATLIIMGVAAAAASHFIALNLRIPGHAIVRVIFPIAFGVALVPRRGAGSTMGLVAAISTIGFAGARFGAVGLGATTSLLLCGIVLDAAIAWTRSGWPLYVGLGLAGLSVNLAAFAVKAISKLAGLGGMGVGGGMGGGGGAGGFQAWFPRAVITYPLCGLAAGLVCAVILFRFRRGDNRQ